MKVSVLIPTNRPGGLLHASASLPQQTFDDFEILIGTPFDPGFGRWVKDDFQGGFWSLNRIYNRLFAEAKGELLVSLQDFIWVPPTGIQNFWKAYEKTGSCITGVGDQYKTVAYDGWHGAPVWYDPRKDWYSGFAECKDALNHEWNWGCFPRAAVMDIGGMDEELDFLGYGGDQPSAVERLRDNGQRFFIDPANEIFAQKHGRPDNWDDKHVILNGRYAARKAALLAAGHWPKLTGRLSL